MRKTSLKRASRTRQASPQMVPRPLPGEPDLVQVDTTWGELQPMRVAEGVATLGAAVASCHVRQ